MDPNEFDLVKVSSVSRPTSVAGAMAGMYRERGRAEAQAVGAGAVNQMVKAAAIAINYLAADGMEMAIIPSFTTINIGGRDVTAIRLALVERFDSNSNGR